MGLQHIHQLLEDIYKVGSTTKQTVHTNEILGGLLTLRCSKSLNHTFLIQQ